MVPQMAQAGAAPQPQIPPAVLQALMARAQQAQGRPQMPGQPQPPGPPQAPQLLPSATAAVPQAGPAQPPAPPIGAPPAAPGVAQNLATFARGANPTGNPAPMRLNTAEMAQMGRFGDSVVAHLAPGEITIPPEIQTPQLMRAIMQAFHNVGVSPAQFTVGTPQNSHNPATGAPEFNLMTSILPAALGAIGSLFLGPEVLAPMLAIGSTAAGAIGGGLGTAAGALLAGESPEQSIMSGVGGAAGSYLGSGITGAAGDALSSSGATPATTAATDASMGAANPFSDAGTTLTNAAPAAASGAGSGGGLLGNLHIGSGLGGAIGSSLGGMLGSALTPGPTSAAAQEPAGFNNPMGPLNTNFNQILGNGNASRPSFTGYDPFASVTGQPFNFYAG